MNQYWLITTTATTRRRLTDLAARAECKFQEAHRSIHYRLSQDGLQAIIQADFPDAVLTFLRAQSWATYLGDYVNGAAEQKVHDYIETNKAKWEKV